MKIFLVEDNTPLNDIISATLKAVGYSVDSFDDGRDAFDAFNDGYDLYIIDINLPHINGLELVKSIKSVKNNANIIIISANIDIETVLKAYDIGANDYIKKPFDIRELIAKIKNNFAHDFNKVKLDGCGIYDKEQKIFIYDNKEIQVTSKEAKLLEVLIRYKNKIVPKNVIEDFVWNENCGTSYVRQLVFKLKKKIPCKLIENHSSTGYRLIPKIIDL